MKSIYVIRLQMGSLREEAVVVASSVGVAERLVLGATRFANPAVDAQTRKLGSAIEGSLDEVVVRKVWSTGS